MSHTYLKGTLSTKKTPQSEPIPGSGQVNNTAGGFAWTISPLDRMRRWLILGSEGGTYYADERKLTKQNAQAVQAALDEHGVAAVEEIIAISEAGRAPKNDPALFALALASAHSDIAVRKAAWHNLARVARIGTHLFHYLDFVQEFRGWGRGQQKAVEHWYTDRPASALAYDVVKYRQRDGWSQRDALRKSTPRVAENSDQDLIFAWVTGRKEKIARLNAEPVSASLRVIEGFERAQRAASPADTANLVREYRLPREALKTEHLNSPDVWIALLETGMPMVALVRNLATMSRNKVTETFSHGERMVVDALTDRGRIARSRLHPVGVLSALLTYKTGRSYRGDGTWTPNARIVDALDEAFYHSFGAVEPSGKRTLIAVDVSGSMTNPIMKVPGLDARMAAGALAMVTARVEPQYEIVVFSSGRGLDRYYGRSTMRHPDGEWMPPASYRNDRWQEMLGIAPAPVSPRQRLDDVLTAIDSVPAGGTDCALPIMYAMERDRPVDTFVILTDNETWAGQIHPAQALKQYRQKTGIDAKLIVVAMTATEFSIADPNDRGMLDVVGFDTDAPNIMSEFSKGNV